MSLPLAQSRISPRPYSFVNPHNVVVPDPLSFERVLSCTCHNRKMTFLLIPRCRGVQRRTQLLHRRNNGTPFVALRTSVLELLNDGGLNELKVSRNVIDLYHKY